MIAAEPAQRAMAMPEARARRAGPVRLLGVPLGVGRLAPVGQAAVSTKRAPSLEFERRWWDEGAECVVGIDEGRGS